MATFIVKQSHFEFGRFQPIALPVRLKVTKSIEQRRDHSRCTDGLADDHVSWLSMQSGLGNNADRAKSHARPSGRRFTSRIAAGWCWFSGDFGSSHKC